VGVRARGMKSRQASACNRNTADESETDAGTFLSSETETDVAAGLGKDDVIVAEQEIAIAKRRRRVMHAIFFLHEFAFSSLLHATSARKWPRGTAFAAALIAGELRFTRH
jgi:hypothetical protein